MERLDGLGQVGERRAQVRLVALGFGLAALSFWGCGGRTTLDPSQDTGSSGTSVGGAGSGAPAAVAGKAARGGAGGAGGMALAGSPAAGAPSSAGAGGSGGAPCNGALELRNVQWFEDNGDGYFGGGERIWVVADLLSVGGPTKAKLSVVADDPRLVPVSGLEQDVYALTPGEPARVTVAFDLPYGNYGGSEFLFSLKLTSVDEPACFAEAVQQRLIVTGTDEVANVCEMVRQLELLITDVTDINGNQSFGFGPGDDFNLVVTLNNPGHLLAIGYAGITVVASKPGVAVRPNEEGWLFAMPADRAQITCGMHIEPTVASGKSVRLTLAPAIMGERCRDVPTTDMIMIIQ